VVVEPHSSVRGGIVANLASEPGVAVVGEASDLEGALAVLAALRPAVVLLDLGLVERGGPGVIDALRERSPGSRILLLYALEGEPTIRRALAAGAHAPLPKDAFREQLIAAIRELGEGRPTFPESRGGAGSDLSVREVEILRLVARGRSDREIAAALAIAEDAVAAHLRRILLEVGAPDRIEAAIAMLKRGALRL
jgi:DNA-binding NarL/FixJ family response regulator